MTRRAVTLPRTVITPPFTLVIDDREVSSWGFTGMRGDARDKYAPIHVPTTRRRLVTGDYTIDGCEGRVAVERKSHEDLIGCMGRDRERFEAEMIRLNAMEFAAVVVECTMSDILHRPPMWSKMQPKVIFRTVVSWQQKYPTVHWWFAENRIFAEHICFRILERFHRTCMKQRD